MPNEPLYAQIEELRKELNDSYKLHAAITPELVALSVRLDQLLNQLPHASSPQ